MYSATNIFLLPYHNVLLTLYDKSIEQTTADMLKLSGVINALCEQIQRLSTVNNQQYLNANNSSVSTQENNDLQQSSPALVSLQEADKSILKQAKDYTEILKTAGKIAKGSVEFAETIESLSGAAAKAKPIVSGVNALVDAFAGAEKWVEATKTVDKIAAAGEMIAGAISVGTTVSKAGGAEAGVFAGLGAMAVSVIAVKALENEKKEKYKVTNFIDEGAKNKNPYLTNLQQSNAYGYDVLARSKQGTQLQIDKRKNRLANDFLKKGGQLIFDSKMAETDHAYMEAVILAMNENLKLKKPSITNLAFQDTADYNNFTKYIDPFNHYSKSVLPFVPVKSNDLPSGEGGASYISYKQDQYNKTHKASIGIPLKTWMDAAIVTAMNQARIQGPASIQKEREAHMKLYGSNPAYVALDRQFGELYKSSLQTVENDKKVKQQPQSAHRGSYSGNRSSHASSRHTTINFNKSLIDHFTINVSNSKEGVTDFKRKVEEVLLEILNSVNTH